MVVIVWWWSFVNLVSLVVPVFDSLVREKNCDQKNDVRCSLSIAACPVVAVAVGIKFAAVVMLIKRDQEKKIYGSLPSALVSRAMIFGYPKKMPLIQIPMLRSRSCAFRNLNYLCNYSCDQQGRWKMVQLLNRVMMVPVPVI